MNYFEQSYINTSEDCVTHQINSWANFSETWASWDRYIHKTPAITVCSLVKCYCYDYDCVLTTTLISSHDSDLSILLIRIETSLLRTHWSSTMISPACKVHSAKPNFYPVSIKYLLSHSLEFTQNWPRSLSWLCRVVGRIWFISSAPLFCQQPISPDLEYSLCLHILANSTQYKSSHSSVIWAEHTWTLPTYFYPPETSFCIE